MRPIAIARTSVIRELTKTGKTLLIVTHEMAFEETTQQLTAALAAPRIQAAIEYASAEEKATLTLRYNGDAYDTTKEGDDLSLSVLKGIVSQMNYSTVDSGDCVNQVVIEL